MVVKIPVEGRPYRDATALGSLEAH